MWYLGHIQIIYITQVTQIVWVTQVTQVTQIVLVIQPTFNPVVNNATKLAILTS